MKYLPILLIFILFSEKNRAQTNGGFEQWDSTWSATYAPELTSILGIVNPLSGAMPGWLASSGYGLCRTPDAYQGNYAVILHNWYSYAREWITQKDSCTRRHGYLNGFAKYVLTDGSHVAWVHAYMLKWNGSSNDTIASLYHEFTADTVYHSFSIPFDYTSALNPDSVFIEFWNARNTDVCSSQIICSFLYIDDVSFSDAPLLVEPNTVTSEFIDVFPNPFQQQIKIDKLPKGNYQLYIKGVDGKMIAILPWSVDNQYNLSFLRSGIYVLEIQRNDMLYRRRIIKE